MKTLDSDAIVFRIPNAKTKLILTAGFLFGLFLLALWSMIQNKTDTTLLLFAFCFCLVLWGGLVLLGWRMLLYTFLAISPRGIEYHALGSHLYVEWVDVEKLETRRVLLGDSWTTATGVAFQQNAIELGRKRRKTKTKNAGRYEFIPVDSFASKKPWQDHEIGKLIRAYAPHLEVEN